MSSDIKFNGKTYPDGGYGTYTRIVEPPAVTGKTYTIEAQWGSRLAVMSGYLKGFSSYGSILIYSREITLATIIRFPRSFEFIPIVKFQCNFQENKNYFDLRREYDLIDIMRSPHGNHYQYGDAGLFIFFDPTIYLRNFTVNGFEIHVNPLAGIPSFYTPEFYARQIAWQAFGI